MTDVVDTQYNAALSKLFSKPIIAELAEKGSSDYLNYIIQKSGFIQYIQRDITYAELFEMVLSYLQYFYRSEYVYKFFIVNKIIANQFSHCVTSYYNEFNIANSKADVVLINETSYVYEIKTEYDSLERLSSQIESYKTAFDYIFVLAHPSRIQSLYKFLDCYPEVGLLSLTDENEIQTLREATSNRQNVNPAYIFDCLRRKEYLDIIIKYFGDIGEIPNTQIYTRCKDLFSELQPSIAHDELVHTLQNRKTDSPMKKLISTSPCSLQPLQMGISLTKKQINSISAILDSNFPFKAP